MDLPTPTKEHVMTVTRIDTIENSTEKAYAWIDELASELGTDDRANAYRVLRAVLHALRDRVTVDEAAQLAAQMPALIRGIYYENWDPSTTPRSYRDPDTFLQGIASEALLHGETEASFAVAAVMRTLRRHVSTGELDQVAAMLPARMRGLLDSQAT